VLRWLVDAWRAYAHRAAGYQSQLLLTIVYLLILGPAGLIGRLFGARLMDLDQTPHSTWLVRANSEKSLTELRRQF
jgi:hypothetical protein